MATSCDLCDYMFSEADSTVACAVCGEAVCDKCRKTFVMRWRARRDAPDDNKDETVCVCLACPTLRDPSAVDVWRELLAMYHALPGADKTIQCMDDVRALIKRREGPRESVFTLWKQMNHGDEIEAPSATDDGDADAQTQSPAKRARPADDV